MYLKILDHKPLIRLLFKGKEQDFFVFLKDYLDKSFLKKEQFLYEVEASKLPKLNDVLFSLKETFQKDLSSAPIPVSFYLFSRDSFFTVKGFLRPGKIYFTNNLKEEISEALSKIKLHYRIEPLFEDLYELVLPSTVEPKLLLNFKDIFFGPFEKGCFFCHSYGHRSSECPGLEIADALLKFKELLRFSLAEIGENLWTDYQHQKLRDSFFDYFYVRHFYLFPSFLKLPFYLTGEIENWAQIAGKFSIPIRGGEIYLALEDLLQKRWSQAELRIKNVEEDFRIELISMFLALFKEDYQRVIYHIERALTYVKSPFLLSYLYFYKGYIWHYLKDIYSAEDNYKLALKEDSSCLPAFYFLNLLNYEVEENPEKIFPFFRHPYLIYLALLEPNFIKHEAELERELENALSSIREEGINRLKEVEDKYHHLKEVMTEEERSEYEAKIKEIRNSIYKGGVALIEEASKRALESALELSGYIFTKSKKIRNELQKYKNLYQNCHNFWIKYPYKVEDSIFGQRLKRSYELLEKMEKRLMRKDLTKELGLLNKELIQLQAYMEELIKLKPALENKWRFRKEVLKFIKRFSLAEGVLTALYLLPFFYPELNFLGSLQNVTSFFILSVILFLLVLLTLRIEKE